MIYLIGLGNNMFLNKQKNKGFVALFTVLIAAVVLSMAIGIANIALKQIVLTSSAVDANKSFYAADSGVECVLYNDIKTQPSLFQPNQTTFQIYCGGFMIQVFESIGTPGLFNFDLPLAESGSCAYVTVDKTTVQTEVISEGSNSPCGEFNSRTVERAIRVTY